MNEIIQPAAPRRFDTLAEIVSRFPEYGDAAAIRFFNGFRVFQTSYAEMFDLVLRCCAWFEEQGIRPGDAVMIWAANGPEWAVAYSACVLSGVVLVPIDARHRPEFIRFVARETGAKRIIRGQYTPDPGVGVASIFVESFFNTLRSVQPGTPAYRPSPGDPAQILYTSGTTGNPKGVVLTQRNQAANVSDVLEVIPVDRTYHLLSVLPLSHALEQTAGFWCVMASGGSVTYLKALKPSALDQVFQRSSITAMVLVPRLLALLKDRIHETLREKKLAWYLRFGLAMAPWWPRWVRKAYFAPVHRRFGAGFHAFVSGGSALPAEVERFWLALGFEIWQGYGLTETSPVLTAARPGARKIGSVGLPMSRVELRLGDDGEVLARGPNVFSGYYQRPDETSAVLRDGWFHTGDVGELDGDGFLFIRSRKKDVIVTADGLNIYPEDVEAVLDSVEGVRESCVLGVGDHEERIHAVLLLENLDSNPDELIRRANARLAPEQQVESFSVWPGAEFPKTTTLKIKKKEVRAGLNLGSQDAAGPQTAGATPLQRILCEMSGLALDALTDSARLGDDLGLSSIDRVELVSRLESEFRIDIDERAVTPETTVAELSELAHHRGRRSPSLRFRRWTLSAPCQWLRLVFEWIVLKPAVWWFCDLHCEGLEHLDELDGPVLFVSNHTSHLDTVLIKLLPPPRLGRRVCPAAWNEYFVVEGFRPFTRAAVWLAWNFSTTCINIFPFSQTAAFRQSMAYAGELADRGWSILLFPEGARTMDGQLLPFQEGVGLLAQNLRIPLVPVAISGGHQILPAGAPWPRRGSIHIRFGEAFLPGGSNPRQLSQKVHHEVESLWKTLPHTT
ncbi:MAG: AMP-binding protein [bacterium]|nr:AMP-binding protein [bacterium]